MSEYPLPNDFYPGSKDWVQSNYAGRVQWLHMGYENMRDQVSMFIDCADKERERCVAMLSLTRAEASLMAGGMSAQEWRTVKAVLDAIKRRIAE